MRTFKEYLCEIGDSKNPYPYKMKIDPMNATGNIKFKTDAKLRYWAEFKPELFPSQDYSGLKVDFGVFHNEPGRSTFDTTNAGLKEAFRVMATLVKGLKEYINKMDKDLDLRFDEILYDASDVGKSGHEAARQRGKLYTAFVKKNLKGATIRNNGPYTAINLKKYYK